MIFDRFPPEISRRSLPHSLRICPRFLPGISFRYRDTFSAYQRYFREYASQISCASKSISLSLSANQFDFRRVVCRDTCARTFYTPWSLNREESNCQENYQKILLAENCICDWRFLIRNSICFWKVQQISLVSTFSCQSWINFYNKVTW